jgi:hypothetical protein
VKSELGKKLIIARDGSQKKKLQGEKTKLVCIAGGINLFKNELVININ